MDPSKKASCTQTPTGERVGSRHETIGELLHKLADLYH